MFCSCKMFNTHLDSPIIFISVQEWDPCNKSHMIVRVFTEVSRVWRINETIKYLVLRCWNINLYKNVKYEIQKKSTKPWCHGTGLNAFWGGFTLRFQTGCVATSEPKICSAMLMNFSEHQRSMKAFTPKIQIWQFREH